MWGQTFYPFIRDDNHSERDNDCGDNRMRKFILTVIFCLMASVCFATEIVYDTFTESVNMALQSHTPDVGGAWVKWTINTTGATVIAANDYVIGDDNGSTAGYFNQQSPASNDYNVIADVYVIYGNPGYVGVLGRGTGNTFYSVHYSTGIWYLNKVIDGVGTDLDTHYDTSVEDNWVTIKLELRDAAKKVYLNDIEILSSNDDSITQVGYGGFRVRATSRVDNFYVNDTGTETARRIYIVD